MHEIRSMSQPSLADGESPFRSSFTRTWGLIVALAFGWFLFLYARGCWNDYWLLKDGCEGTAIVTHLLWTGHNGVAYRYTVAGKQYSGESGRNYRDPRYIAVQPGGTSVVYYSYSHPWLSSLNRPEAVGAGLPVALLVLFLEALAILTIIKPKHRWAFDFSGRKVQRG